MAISRAFITRVTFVIVVPVDVEGNCKKDLNVKQEFSSKMLGEKCEIKQQNVAFPASKPHQYYASRVKLARAQNQLRGMENNKTDQ